MKASQPIKQVSDVALVLCVLGSEDILTVFPIPLLNNILLGVETGKYGDGGYDNALSDRHRMERM